MTLFVVGIIDFRTQNFKMSKKIKKLNDKFFNSIIK